MHPGVLQIGKDVVARVFKQETKVVEVSIFLCGGSVKDPKNLRKPLRTRLESIEKSKYKYRVYYPEHLFLDLIHGHDKRSLLDLENLLARSVSAIVLIVESPGTFAELGAFANHAELSEKLIVIMDEKYRTKQSFINLGPIRSLQLVRPRSVIYEPFDSPDFERLSKMTSEAARRLAIDKPPCKDLLNPIEARRAFLALVCVLSPISRSELSDLVVSLTNERDRAGDATRTTINSLVLEGFMEDTSSGLSVLAKGMNFLTDSQYAFWGLDYYGLGALRLKAMNLRLRRLKKKCGVRIP